MLISDLSSDVCSSDLVAGKRILELGCGLGLASLVLRRRGADVVASDYHPLAETFLAYNAALNELPAVPYRTLRWDTPNDSLGRFDLIIGSDILYERDHAERLSALLPRHAQRVCRSEEHTSDLQSLMRISYAVFCLQKKNQKHKCK